MSAHRSAPVSSRSRPSTLPGRGCRCSGRPTRAGTDHSGGLNAGAFDSAPLLTAEENDWLAAGHQNVWRFGRPAPRPTAIGIRGSAVPQRGSSAHAAESSYDVPVVELPEVCAGAVGEADSAVGVDREFELLLAERYLEAVEFAVAEGGSDLVTGVGDDA